VAFMGLTKTQRQQLELEIVPNESRLRLTRVIRDVCGGPEAPIELMKMARFVNMANNVMRRQIYELETDDWGEDYPHAAYAVIHSQFELIMRRPSTVELAEILGDYLQSDILDIGTVNKVLRQGNCGFAFESTGTDSRDREKISIKILSTDSIPEPDLSDDHPNIRALAKRMDNALVQNDPAGVLHAAASIFETLAKDVVKNPNIQNQPLGSFFQSYRNNSMLPAPILDYMLQVYNDRNTEPLSGHGSTQPPSITKGEAVLLLEMTKAIVRSERKLAISGDSAD
jgi:hypothetical protein